MQSTIVETIIGAVVLAVTILFVTYAYRVAGSTTQAGYVITANFDRVDGLALGADVRLSGIKVGAVTAMTLNTESYEAEVEMTINPDVKLYDGTAVKITSAGLLGNQYVSLDPGGGIEQLANGSEITNATGTVDLMSLISRFIFNSGNSGGGQEKSE